MSGGLPHYYNSPLGAGLNGLGGHAQQAQMQAQMALATPRAVPRWFKPDPKQPDTLGWRAWLWSEERECLSSPHHATEWPNEHLTASAWDEADAVRGVTGIHARLVPRHWKIVGWPDGDGSSDLDDSPHLVTGIVERFGRYVLGTAGWRAEQVIIRELLAPSTKIGLALEQKYPDVIVHYSDQEEEPCKSEKSSALEKGSRLSPLPQFLPSPSVIRKASPLSPPSLAFHQAQQQYLQAMLSPPPPPPLVSAKPSTPEEYPIQHPFARLMPLWWGLVTCWITLLAVRLICGSA